MTLEQKSDYLDIKLLGALHKVAPEIKISEKERSIAWSDTLISIKREKNNLLKRAKKTKNASLYKRAKALYKTFRMKLCDAKR